jgi:hypothetical protein
VSTTVPNIATSEQRFNQVLVHGFMSTGSGPFSNAEEMAMALTFIEMKGIVDESTRRRLFLQGGAASGRTFTAILTRHLKGIPYRSNGDYGQHKKGKRFQQFFKTFQLKNSCSENNNQTTGL